MSIKVGDFVKGKENNGYGITNDRMTRGLVTDIKGNSIKIKVMEHLDKETYTGWVDTIGFEVIGHVKEFNRGEVLELLKSGCKKAILDYDLSGADLSGADLSGADLSGADLSGADLSGANLDFSCFPLWCGGLKLKIDKRIACQLTYHLCSMQCEDAEYIKMRNSILSFANQFHRVGECGTLLHIEPEEEENE